MFIFGTRLFGKVDAVPGLGHVATKFFHINFLPLIPLEGWFVLGQEGNQWRGRAIPMSGKSVLTAWMRFATFCLGVAFLFIAAVRAATKGGLGWQFLFGGVLLVVGAVNIAFANIGDYLVPLVLLGLGAIILVRGVADRRPG